MTDADLLPLGQAARTAFWRDQLQQAPHIEARVGHSAISPITRVASACSSRLSPSRLTTGSPWGDAAAAFDPLSSHGGLLSHWNLRLMAAEAIDRRLCHGHPKALTHLQTAGAGVDPTSRYLTLNWALPAAPPADFPIVLSYNSNAGGATSYGNNWEATYHRFVEVVGGSVNLLTPQGMVSYSSPDANNNWVGSPNNLNTTLNGTSTTGWTEAQPDGTNL